LAAELDRSKADFAELSQEQAQQYRTRRTELERQVAVGEARTKALKTRMAEGQERIQQLERELAGLKAVSDRWLRAEPQIRELRVLFAHARAAVPDLAGRYDDQLRDKLSLLLFYSLGNLALSVCAGEENFRAAMLVNVHEASRRLSEQKLPHFSAVLQSLGRIEPQVSTLQVEVSSKQGPGQGLFRPSLECLRGRGQLDLAPFYYDVDEAGGVYAVE
jgi:hypothetical protein